MKGYMRLAALSVLVLAATHGCHTDEPLQGPDRLAKVLPSTVSVPGAWSLFDRSIQSEFVPSTDPVRISLEGAARLSAVKVYGSSPYRLSVTGKDGTSIGFASIDLSKLGAGWHVLPSTALVSTSAVELRFAKTGTEEGHVPELELWAVDDAPAVAKVDLGAAARDLPATIVRFDAKVPSATLAPSDCASFDVDFARAPTAFRRAHLVYETKNLFRPFAITRSINGLAEQGGTWLGGDTSARTFIEEIDPSILQLGLNDVRFCSPSDASRGVTIENVRLVAEIDDGTNLGALATLATGARDGSALLDDDPATKMDVGPAEQIQIAFERLIAPDAILFGATRPLEATDFEVSCVDATKRTTTLSTVLVAPGELQVNGGAAKCVSLLVTSRMPATFSTLHVLGSGAAEPVDWPHIVVTSPVEHFGDRAWVGGFVAKPAEMSSAVRVEVAGKPDAAMTGDFGRMLTRTSDVGTPWAVSVTARLPDGTTQSKQVVLDRDSRQQLLSGAADDAAAKDTLRPDALYGHVGSSVVVRANLLTSSSIHLGTKVGLEIPAGAVSRPTDISIKHLDNTGLPALEPGMVNVTSPRGHGFEFLPHGQHFGRAIEVSLPFDPTLIPDGMSPDDVHTYYFDPADERWKKLERAAVDLGDHVIRSRTEHFTIMIDAVLAVPKNPAPLSFDPTAESSIGAANPAANIDMIEPPQANSQGDARLSLPIRAPAGRGAYSPNLAIAYSSANGNGWLGVGWDIPVSRVEIDTRWGVPTYGENEDPRYLLDGAELVPTLDNDGPLCQDGGHGRRYHTRIEGAFAHILRCDHASGGNQAASFYGFEVHDRNGTVYVYGPTNNQGAEGDASHAELADPESPHAIFRWFLRRVTDVHGNTTTFDYAQDDIASAQAGREVYIKSISYTQHPNLAAAYRIDFTLDDGKRGDAIISARAGFKTVTQHLLRSIEVSYRGAIIRQYVLTYTAGQFGKSLLSGVKVYGAGGCSSPTAGTSAFAALSCGGANFFFEHTFSYFAEQEAFQAPIPFTVGGVLPGHRPLAMGASSSTSGGLFVTGFISQDVTATLGTDLTVGSRDEVVGMYDMNGDGLPDDVYTDGTAVAARYNIAGPDFVPDPGTAIFERRPTDGSITGLSAMGHESHTTWNADASASFGFNASAGKSWATTTSGRFITDINGDGFPDYLSGRTSFGHPCSQGTCFDEGAYSATSSIDPRENPLLTSFSEALSHQLILADPVVQWTAPYSGHIKLGATARKVQPGGTTGVTVELYQGDALLRGFSIAPPDTSQYSILDGTELDVQSGDTLYLRVRSGSADAIAPDVSGLDAVATDLHVDYTQTCATQPCTAVDATAHDPAGEALFSFDSQSDFRIGGTPTFVVAPVAGTFELHGLLDKAVSAADLRVCVQRFPAASPGFTTNLDVACDATGGGATNVSGTTTLSAGSGQTLPIDASIPVQQGELVLLRVESDFSFDPGNVGFRATGPTNPIISYSRVCLPNGTGDTCSSDPESVASVKLPLTYTTGFGPYVVLTDTSVDSPRQPFVAAQAGTVTLAPFDPGSDYILVVRSDRQQLIQEFDCRAASCGSLHVQPFAVAAGESVTIEMVSQGGGPLLTTVTGDLSGSTFTTPLYASTSGSSARAPTPFAGGYHGWRAGLWNDNEAFKPTELMADYQTLSTLVPARLAEIVRTAVLPVASFGNDPFAGNVPAWIEPGSLVFVSASAMAPGFIGVVFDSSTPDQGTLFVAGANARVSGTSSGFAGISTSVLNVENVFNVNFGVNVTSSDTVSTSELVDLTGDGIADIINGKQVVVGDLTTNPSARTIYPDIAPADGFRKRHGFDYSVNLGDSAALPITTARGRTILEGTDKPFSGGLGWGSDVGIAIGRSATSSDLIDLNGDGLPDLVRRGNANIYVRYNLGKRWGAEEVFGQVDSSLLPDQFSIDTFQTGENDLNKLTSLVGENALDTTSNALDHTTTITQNSSNTTNLILYKSSSTTRQTATRVTRQLQDLNGDGLPDLIVKKDHDAVRVQYNLGNNFGPPVAWGTPAWTVPLAPDFDSRVTALGLTGPDVLGGTGSQISHSSDQQIGFPIPGTPFEVGGHLGGADDVDTYELSLMDINGDGAADHVLRRATTSDPTTVYVKFNEVTGKANLLQQVQRPLGGSISLDYQRVGNTQHMPHSRHVLKSVEVDDGLTLGPNYDSPTIFTSISYVDGSFSRSEKEFFGFFQVTTTRSDGVKVVDQYENNTYPLHGRLLDQKRVDSSGNLFHEHSTTYDTRPVLGGDGNPLSLDSQCIENLHPLLGPDACTPLFVAAVHEEDTRSEGGALVKKHKTSDTSFDRFGNVLETIDEGDDAIASDDLDLRATYLNATDSWVLGRATALVVRGGDSNGPILRSRQGTYDTFGDLASVSVDTGSGTATTVVGYDAFGNVDHITSPPNESGQQQTYDVTFDPDVGMFAASTRDGFGYQATAQYDVRFGVALSETDIHGVTLSRAVDQFGRLVWVRGPYDASQPGVAFEYHTEARPAQAITTMIPAAPPGYSGPLPPATQSIVFADGFGRPVETRKTAVVGAVAGMTTSGLVARDALGRVVKTYQPFFTAGNTGSFLLPTQPPLYTSAAYDVLDRVVQTQYPDGALETASFDITASPSGVPMLLSRAVDPNGHARETYTDVLGHARAFVEHPSQTSTSFTAYDYLATGELAKITDAEGNQTVLGYDLRGQRTTLSNPDTGLIEDHFDLMGNRVALIEPNHRALGVQVHFVFDRDRLSTIDYPSKPDVSYQYGAPGSGTSAGRVTQVTDETGNQQFTYGALGEVQRTLRTFIDSGASNPTPVIFDLRTTSDSFGRQLRIAYPDGELVTNSYDAAGVLRAVDGAGTGWTRNYVSDLRYDVFGNRTHAVFGNGDVSDWTYEPARVRLSSLVTKLSSQTKVQDLHYTYDAGSNPTEIDNNLPTTPVDNSLPGTATQSFTYDGVDRLVHATGSGTLNASKRTTYDLAFNYSPSHNILQKSSIHNVIGNGGQTSNPSATNYASTYSYAARPHLPQQIGDLAVAYDPSGNPTTRTRGGVAQHLVWDDDGRLVQVSGMGANQRNLYDAGGRRVLRQGQGTTIFASDLFEFDAGHTGIKHIFAGSARVASESNAFTGGANPAAPARQGTAYFMHQTHLPSVGVVTSQDGSVNDAHEYFPDGAAWIDTGKAHTVDGLLFSGKPFDPDTGFYDFGQRFYDPRTSMWLGGDPAFLGDASRAVASPLYLAPGAFAAHNPLRFGDPNGEDPVLIQHTGYSEVKDSEWLYHWQNINNAQYPDLDQASLIAAENHRVGRADHPLEGANWIIDLPVAFATGGAYGSTRGVGKYAWGGIRGGLRALGGRIAFDAIRTADTEGKAGCAASGVSGGGCAGGATETAAADGVVDLSTAGRSLDEVNAIKEYARRANDYLEKVGPQEVKPTAGILRRAASAAARAERQRAERAGTPYQGQAGHVPDTAISGQPEPPAGWLDMPGFSNQVCGGVLGCRIGQKISRFTVDGNTP